MAGVCWDKDPHSRQAWLPWSCLICFNSTELSTLCHADSVPQGSSQDEKVKPLNTGAESKCVNKCLLSCQNYILNCSVATEIPSPRTQCPSFRTLSAKDRCRMAVNRNQAGLNMNHRICLVTQDSTRKCLMDLGALRSVGFARDLRSDGAVIDSWGGLVVNFNCPGARLRTPKKRMPWNLDSPLSQKKFRRESPRRGK